MPNNIEKQHTNHLINETSPYLLDHAHNAVDWYPWGEEALTKAKDENKLIFLSIGYHACHWCHVMAHESFEDEVVASILNEHYVCIKVDREERPDLDTIYMNACQIMTGSGGWPLNLWLTPDQKPIYAGTYFPKDNLYGRTGFIGVITHLRKMWRDDRLELLGKSQEIMSYLNKQASMKPEEVDASIMIQAVKDLTKRYDQVHGGFSEAPKFPSPHQLLYLTHYHQKHASDDILEMITGTLDAMYLGGIYDHVGGGFARYSVDEKWLVPHFEKMLYDNALLLRAYNYGYLLTHKPLYKEVAYGIVAFLRRELLSLKGGFYTAIDADSDGVEGKYYVFTPGEIEAILGDEANAYMATYDITKKGNFEGSNIPNLIGKEATVDALLTFKDANAKILDYRERRVKPALDYKILTSMNGLILGSLSHMYRLYNDELILTMATEIQGFINCELVVDGKLCGVSSKKVINKNITLDDFAYYIEGLIELYQATMKPLYLEEAMGYMTVVNDEFWDDENGGYYLTGKGHEALIRRPKECYDSALPSGNSVMANNLLRLSRITDDESLQVRYDNLVRAFGKTIKQGPSHLTYLLISLLHRTEGTNDLVVAITDASELPQIMADIRCLTLKYYTYDVRVNRSDKKPMNNETTYYVCQDFSCLKPTTHKPL